MDTTTHRIAWDGVDFPVPRDWEISNHGYDRGVSSIILEDSGEVRLQMDWAPATDKRSCERVSSQHSQLVSQLESLSKNPDRIEDVPSGWTLEEHQLSGGTGLVIGMLSPSIGRVSVFVRLHADSDPDYPLREIALQLVSAFSFHEKGNIPWYVYDLRVRVPRLFKLRRTSLLAGRKLLIFESRLRRLWIWRFSLAERLLQGRPTAEALAEELNRHKDFPGVRFHAERNGALVARRRRAHPFGHREEIGRWCFRYDADYRHDKTNDALLLRVFQYRHETDRSWIRELILDDNNGF